MSLFDLLPSLKGILVSRSFDPALWPVPIHASGSDIIIGTTDVCAEVLRHTCGYYVDSAGEPVCPAADDDAPHPVLVTRIAAAQVAGGRAVVHIDAALPLNSAIADLAFAGQCLAGATLADITVVDAAGHRRTVHAELPASIVATETIVIALRPVADRARIVV
ncbi:hypothetical protein ACPXB3_05605 [Gordonia sp. DT219]|uniref:hypothetical protein n=1 Tax=Gordonia sp. DT219 TaxID=3416658 RepID=UPI003CEA8D3C